MGIQTFETPDSIALLNQIIQITYLAPTSLQQIAKETGYTVYSLNKYMAYLKRLNLVEIDSRVKNQPFYRSSGKEYVLDMEELDAPRRIAPKIKAWRDPWLFALHIPFTEAV